jgi:hypothetical protein
MHVGKPELAERGIFRSTVKERHTESGGTGDGRHDVVYRWFREAVGQQEDTDNAQCSREDVPDIRVVVGTDGRLEMPVDESGEE